jgi:hypothetical protein
MKGEGRGVKELRRLTVLAVVGFMLSTAVFSWHLGEKKYGVEASFAGVNGEAELEIKGSYVQIEDIIAKPLDYDGNEIKIKGIFIGWSMPEHEIMTPMVTRNDWIVEDETGAIYVTKLSSEPMDPVNDVGTRVMVSGVVRLRDGKPYIEGESLRVL